MKTRLLPICKLVVVLLLPPSPFYYRRLRKPTIPSTIQLNNLLDTLSSVQYTSLHFRIPSSHKVLTLTRALSRWC